MVSHRTPSLLSKPLCSSYGVYHKAVVLLFAIESHLDGIRLGLEIEERSGQHDLQNDHMKVGNVKAPKKGSKKLGFSMFLISFSLAFELDALSEVVLPGQG